jgi:hypothetical protein
MKIDNLFQRSGGYFCCLVSDDAPMKRDDGVWVDGVIYATSDGFMRSMSKERWESRFKPVAEYTGDDESVKSISPATCSNSRSRRQSRSTNGPVIW